MGLSKLQRSTNKNDSHTASHHSKRHHSDTSRESRPKQRGHRCKRDSERGFTTMGATLLLLTFLTATGFFTLLHQIGDRVKKQIQLDQQTGKAAITLRSSMITYENSKKRIKIAHSAMLAGCVYLPACPGFQRAYQITKKIEEGIQEIAEQNWNLQRLKNFQTLPSLEQFSKIQNLEICLKKENLISVSKVWKIEGMNSNGWKIAWVR